MYICDLQIGISNLINISQDIGHSIRNSNGNSNGHMNGLRHGKAPNVSASANNNLMYCACNV